MRQHKLFLLFSALLLIPLLAACGGSPTPQTGSVPSTAAPGAVASNVLIGVAPLAQMLNDPTLRLVDFGSKQEYAAGHIPGAINLTWDQFNVTDTSAASISEWQTNMAKLLGNAGIAPGNPVVVYDHGTLYGARLWWVLDQLGHADKHILDGGFPAWEALKQQTSTTTTTYPPTTYAAKPDPAVLASETDVLAALKQPNLKLVDARSPGEYADGHIPGAVNMPFDSMAQDRAPRYFKTPAELQAMYAAAGITPDSSVVTYCSTGVRGSVDYVSLLMAGFKNVRVYTGSWAEWGSNSSLPVEK